MFLTLQVLTVCLVAIAMGLALAHALELPGKLRLDEHTYLAVQTIYYPGFTIGGSCEPLAIIATLVLLFTTPRGHPRFWWILAAFLAIVAMQIVFWLITQPINRFWLKKEQLGRTGNRFFSLDRTASAGNANGTQDWRCLRDRWEYSHVVRAILSAIALIAIVVAVEI